MKYPPQLTEKHFLAMIGLSEARVWDEIIKTFIPSLFLMQNDLFLSKKRSRSSDGVTLWIKPKRSSKTKVHRVKSTLRKIERVLAVSFTSPIGETISGKWLATSSLKSINKKKK